MMRTTFVLLISLFNVGVASASCPGTVDYDVEPGTMYTSLSSVIVHMKANSISSAVVCVKPGYGSTSSDCPGKTYTETVDVNGVSLDIHAETPVCWKGTSSVDPVISFTNAGTSSIHDFASVACQGGAGALGAVYVDDTDLTINGTMVNGHMTYITCAHPGQSALAVTTDGSVDSSSVEYTESTIGVSLFGGTSESPRDGGSFTSTGDRLSYNELAIRVEDYGGAYLSMDIVHYNDYIGYAGDDSEITVTDTRIQDNSHPTCTTTYSSINPSFWPSSGQNANGFLAENDADATFVNDRWIDNCTHKAAQEGLLRSVDTSDVVVQNNTFDNNETWVVIKNRNTGSLSVKDTIIADDSAAYSTSGSGYADNGISCVGGETIDEVVLWQIEYDWEYGYNCTATNKYYADPKFISYTVGPSQRWYFLDWSLSPYIDGSTTRTASSVFSSGYGTEDHGWTTDMGSDPWVDDTGLLDLGFHWWSEI